MFSADDYGDFDDTDFLEVSLDLEESCSKGPSERKRKSFELNDNQSKKHVGNYCTREISDSTDPLGLNRLLQNKKSSTENRIINPYKCQTLQPENNLVSDSRMDDDEVSDNILSSALDKCHYSRQTEKIHIEDIDKQSEGREIRSCVSVNKFSKSDTNHKVLDNAKQHNFQSNVKVSIPQRISSDALKDNQTLPVNNNKVAKVIKTCVTDPEMSPTVLNDRPKLENSNAFSAEPFTSDSELDFALGDSPEWLPEIERSVIESGTEKDICDKDEGKLPVAQNRKVLSNFTTGTIQSSNTANTTVPVDNKIEVNKNREYNTIEKSNNNKFVKASVEVLNTINNDKYCEDEFKKPNTNIFENHSLRTPSVHTSLNQILRSSSTTNFILPVNSCDKTKNLCDKTRNSVPLLSVQTENKSIKSSIAEKLPVVQSSKSDSPIGFRTPQSIFRHECATPNSKPMPSAITSLSYTPRNSLSENPLRINKGVELAKNELDNIKDLNYQRQSNAFDTPLVGLTRDKDSQIETPTNTVVSSSSTGKRKRKFPGPAGVLPKLRSGINLNEVNMLKPMSPSITPRKRVQEANDIPNSQSCEEKFQDDPWITMQKDLEPGAKKILHEFCIQSVLKKASKKLLPKGKVPVVCVLVDQLSTHNAADASVLLRDTSGEMKGTIHRLLMKEYPNELVVGTVLVLRQCGVFSPSPRSHYLNITPNNVVRIYAKTTDGQTSKNNISDFVSDDFIIPEVLPVSLNVTNPVNHTGNSQCNKSPFGVIGSNTSFNIARNNRPTFQQAYSPHVDERSNVHQRPRSLIANGVNSNRNPQYVGFASPVLNRPVLSNSSFQSRNQFSSGNIIKPQSWNPYINVNTPQEQNSLSAKLTVEMSPANMHKGGSARPVQYCPNTSYLPNHINSNNNVKYQPNTNLNTLKPVSTVSANNFEKGETNSTCSAVQKSHMTPDNTVRKGFTFRKSPLGNENKLKSITKNQCDDVKKLDGIDFSLQDDNLDELLTGIDEEMLTDM